MFYLAGSVSKPEIFHFRAEILHCNLTVRKVENANELLKWKFEGGWTGTAGDKLLGLSSSFLDWESATPLRWGRSTIGLNWFWNRMEELTKPSSELLQHGIVENAARLRHHKPIAQRQRFYRSFTIKVSGLQLSNFRNFDNTKDFRILCE